MRHRIGVIGAGVFECEKGGRRRWLDEIINDASVSEALRKATTNARDNSVVHLRSFYFYASLFNRRNRKYFVAKMKI